MSQEEDLVPVFVPSLAAVLIAQEDKKGEPLTPEEVLQIRDDAICIMMPLAEASKMEEHRYRDIDPENCWYEFQLLRRELDRKPDLDPGPKFNQIASSDPEYQQTIVDAQNTLDQFRAMLPEDGSPMPSAMVKTLIEEGENRAFMWLMNTMCDGDEFVAMFFEVPQNFTEYAEGDFVRIAAQDVMDWMVNDEGTLHGGYSIRYQRERKPEAERADYDAYIGVTRYA